MRCGAANCWGGVDITWESDLFSGGSSAEGGSGVVTVGPGLFEVSCSGLELDGTARERHGLGTRLIKGPTEWTVLVEILVM